MRATLWGTRGSVPAAGPDTVRYGGNTSCVEVRGDDGTLLVLDAGTGVRRLGAQLDGDVGRIDVLLTHLHMDHIQGLGFFGPLFQADREVHLWGPPSSTLDLRGRLSRYLSPPLFPVRLREMTCRLTLHHVPPEPFRIGGLEIVGQPVCHPGTTLGYRIREDGRTLAYLPDHEPALGCRRFPLGTEWTSGYELAAGVDLLLHDAQYTPEEYEDRVGWGHSTLDHAVRFAGLAGIQALVTFHHDPNHGDDLLDRLLDEATSAGPPFPIRPGREGVTFDI